MLFRTAQYTYLAEPCTWSPQSVLSSHILLLNLLTMCQCNLTLYLVCLCVSAARTQHQLVGETVWRDYVQDPGVRWGVWVFLACGISYWSQWGSLLSANGAGMDWLEWETQQHWLEQDSRSQPMCLVVADEGKCLCLPQARYIWNVYAYSLAYSRLDQPGNNAPGFEESYQTGRGSVLVFGGPISMGSLWHKCVSAACLQLAPSWTSQWVVELWDG